MFFCLVVSELRHQVLLSEMCFGVSGKGFWLTEVLSTAAGCPTRPSVTVFQVICRPLLDQQSAEEKGRLARINFKQD